LIRLLLIPVIPISSNDTERYFWDGAVTFSGFDPYITSANHPDVQSLREVWPTPEEHAKYPTIYPPGALMMFTLSALAGVDGALIFWKTIIAGAGIISVFFIKPTLEYYGRVQNFSLIALSPLMIMETGIGAHVDALITLGISIALYCHAKQKWTWLGAAIGWSSCVKFLPILLIGPLFLALSFKPALKTIVSCLAVISLIYGITIAIGFLPIGIIATFFEKWRFGSPVFNILEHYTPQSYLIITLGFLATILISISAWLAWKKHLLPAMIVVIAIPLLLSPVVFPWYLLALIPFLALSQSRFLLMWTTAAPLHYIVLNRWVSEKIWEPEIWPFWAVAFAWLIGIILDFLRRRKAIEYKMEDGLKNVRTRR